MMAVYKRGDTYWYEFQLNSQRYRESTHQGNQRVAEQLETARKTQILKGDVGIADKPAVPTFQAFAPRFRAAIQTQCASKPKTVTFYETQLRRLLEYEPLPGTRLDAIGEEFIETMKAKRSVAVSRRKTRMSIASINRELATLRRMLHLAHEWKVIDRIPKIRLFGGEAVREFVLTHEQEQRYLAAAPQPLADIAMLCLDTGVRASEAAGLEWKNVHLKPAAGSKFGYIQVTATNSKNSKARNLSLTARVAAMLKGRHRTITRYAFAGEAGEPYLVSSLDHQHAELRTALKLPTAFVIHSLRHTMLTRLGESGADAFTIMRIAGHSSVTISQRYVHPSPESLETAFERMDALNESRRQESPQNPHSGEKGGMNNSTQVVVP
jgi:integrase